MSKMTSHIQKELLKITNDNFVTTMDKYDVTEKMLEVKMDRIREWYKMQPHLPTFYLENQYLMRHLAVNKFDEEKTKKKMEALFTARTFIPEFFQDRDPWNARVSKALKSLEFIVMPSLTEKKQRIILFRLNIDNLDVYDTDLTAMCSFIMADIRLQVDSLLGDIFIVDMANLTFNQVKQIQLPSIKKIVFVYQDCYGAVLEELHIINAPPVAELAISVVKATLKKKLSDRLVVHSSMDNFRKIFPMKYLPKDMGGDVPLTVKEIATQWETAIKTPEMRQFLMDFESRKTDESLRLGKKDFIIDDMVGMRGTFRKLDLD